jgi:anti-sigma factor (TIGR02949 family)
MKMTDREIRSCEDALSLLAAYLDGELKRGVGDEVERHLEKCRSCYSRAEFERRLKQKVAESGRAEVRPELRDRVSDLIRGFAEPTAGSD